MDNSDRRWVEIPGGAVRRGTGFGARVPDPIRLDFDFVLSDPPRRMSEVSLDISSLVYLWHRMSGISSPPWLTDSHVASLWTQITVVNVRRNLSCQSYLGTIATWGSWSHFGETINRLNHCAVLHQEDHISTSGRSSYHAFSYFELLLAIALVATYNSCPHRSWFFQRCNATAWYSFWVCFYHTCTKFQYAIPQSIVWQSSTHAMHWINQSLREGRSANH